MAFTHRITHSWSNGSSTISASSNVSAETEIAMDVVVAEGVTTQRTELALDVEQVASFYIVSDVDVTLRFLTNSTPIVVPLTANVPFFWTSDGNYENPLTSDVTALRLANDGTSDATVKLRFLIDTTTYPS